MTQAASLKEGNLLEGEYSYFKVGKEGEFFTFHDESKTKAGYLSSAQSNGHYNANFAPTVADGAKWSFSLNPNTYAANFLSQAGVYLDFNVYQNKLSNAEFCGNSGEVDDVYLFQVMRDPIKATDVTIAGEKSTIKVNEQLQLTAKTTPEDCDDEIVFSVAEGGDSIISIDQNGLVKGLSVGEADVVATAGTIEKRFHIVVEAGETKATGLSIVAPENAVYEVGLSVNLSLSWTPKDTTNQEVTWSSDDTSIATVDEKGKVSCLKKGETTIHAVSAYEGVAAELMINIGDYSGYKKVASVSEIEVGDKLILAVKNGNKEIAAGNKKSGYYVSSSDVDPDEVGIRNPGVDVGIYTVEKGNTANHFSFKCQGGYFRAYKNGNYSNAELSTSITADSSWSITDNQDGTFYLQNESGLFMEYYKNSFTGFDSNHETDAFKIHLYIQKTPKISTGIVITKKPLKCNYREGAIFDPTGMEVTAMKPDGSSEVITNYTYPTEPIKKDSTKVVISYGEETAELPIQVKDYKDEVRNFKNDTKNETPTSNDYFTFSDGVKRHVRYEQATFNAATLYAGKTETTYTYMTIQNLGEIDQITINKYAKKAEDFSFSIYSGDKVDPEKKISVDTSKAVADTTYDKGNEFLYTINIPDGVTQLLIINESKKAESMYEIKVGHLELQK